MVEWLAIAGGPLSTQELGTLLGTTSEEAIMRLCARGLCDRKSDAIDFRHLLTRDVAYAALEPKAPSPLAPRARRALAPDQARPAASRRPSSRALRPRGGRATRRRLLPGGRPGRAASYQMPQATRYYGRAITSMPADDPALGRARGARGDSTATSGRRRERLRHLGRPPPSRARACATPRVVCIALLRTARFDADEGKLAHGLPVARRAAEVARQTGLRRSRSRQRPSRASSSASSATFRAPSPHAIAPSPRATRRRPGHACARARRGPAGARRAPRGGSVAWRGRRLVRGRHRGVPPSNARRQEARAKNSLAYAMFVQGRYEDAITLALASLQINVAIGGRFQIAQDAGNVGFAYAASATSAGHTPTSRARGTPTSGTATRMGAPRRSS